MPAHVLLPLLAAVFLTGLLAGLVAPRRPTRSTPRASGAVAVSLPPDLWKTIMALSQTAQIMVDEAAALGPAIDAYITAQVASAEAAKDAQTAEDFAGLKAAFDALKAKVTPAATTEAPVAEPAATGEQASA